MVARFRAFLTEHGGRPENIRQLCCDMSPAFIKGARENFPTAKLTFDKFHVIKIVNEAVDETRREERDERSSEPYALSLVEIPGETDGRTECPA